MSFLGDRAYRDALAVMEQEERIRRNLAMHAPEHPYVSRILRDAAASVGSVDYRLHSEVTRHFSISEQLRIGAASVAHLPNSHLLQTALGYEKQDWWTASGIRQAARTEKLTRASMLSISARHLLVDPIATRLAQVETLPWWRESEHLNAFMRTSAFADRLALSTRVSPELTEASRCLSFTGVSGLGSLAEYRTFLDTSGLILPHWPQPRLLKRAEKRRRLKLRLTRNAEPPHVRKAKSLVHRYELVLREIIDDAMTGEFGEDWAQERLALCGCNALLGRWKKRGGGVLDHADYTHYALIMTRPDHYQAIFAFGFDDREELTALILDARRLRAASHHANPNFGPEDLLKLRITWRTIEQGLVALTEDYAFDY